MNVSIVVIRGIAEELNRRGIDAVSVLSSAHVPASRLDDPTARLTLDEYVDVVTAAIEATQDPALGLRVGVHTQATLHVIGHAALASVTLRDAFDVLSRYAPLINDSAEYIGSVRGDLATLQYANDSAPPEVAAFGAEYAFAMLFAVMRQFVPGALAREVRFRHEAKVDVAIYESAFGCPVSFECPDNAIVVDAAYLHVRQHHADPPLASLLVDRAESMLSTMTVRERLPSQIREIVRRASSPSELGVETIAETLGVGSRTLRRRLGHGGGVRAIVASTKREIAEQLLRDNEITIKEISYRLGFSEPSAFHRAFKRWTKMTPVDFRTAVRGTRVDEAGEATRDTLLDAPRQRVAR